VQDAVLGDGNTSSFLAVDGIVEAWSWKANYKNLTIPSGFQLQLSSLEVLSGTTTFTAVNDADLANKVGSLPAELVGAQVKLEWAASGPVMTITRLGGTLTGFDLKLDTQPVVLPHQVMSSNDLTQGTTFEYKTGDITFTVNSILTVDDPDDPGRLSGYFKITQGSTPTETFLCEGDFFWFLA
jgi:hypothetical protein